MVFSIEDWEFDVDLSQTMAYSAAEAAEHCTCAYCRNFYAAVDDAYPQLRPFLANFGVDVEAPDELMPFTSTNLLNLYAVCGKIRKAGSSPIFVSGLRIDPESQKVSMVNTACPEPLFILSVGPFDIPWVLSEPPEETEIVSPANRPSFLKRMVNWLLGRNPSDGTQ